MAENELVEDLPEEVEEPQVEEPVEETPEEEAPAEDTPPVDEKPDASALQAEIERLEQKQKKLQEDTKYWREEKARERAEYFKGKREDVKPPPPASLGAEPRIEDFEDYEKYNDAKLDFKVEQAKAAWAKEAEDRAKNQQLQLKETELQAKIKRGFEKYEDFEDVALSETVPITPVIKDILADCEYPEDVAYYLGQNRPEAIKISHMTPLAAAREIARIEMKFDKVEPSTETVTKPKKITEAPAPITPVGSTQTGGSHNKDPEKMTAAEYNEWRMKSGAKPY